MGNSKFTTRLTAKEMANVLEAFTRAGQTERYENNLIEAAKSNHWSYEWDGDHGDSFYLESTGNSGITAVCHTFSDYNDDGLNVGIVTVSGDHDDVMAFAKYCGFEYEMEIYSQLMDYEMPGGNLDY